MFELEKGALFYLIKWPLRAPVDAYRAGEKYHLLLAVLAFFLPGIPWGLLRIPLGVVGATYCWYAAMKP